MDNRTAPSMQQLLEYREKVRQFAQLKSDLEDFERKYNTSCIIFKAGGKCGLKDAVGEIILPAIYDDIRNTFKDKYRNRPVPVVQSGMFGLAATDGSGALLLQCIYDYVVYKGGYWLVQKGVEQGVYARGKLIWPIECDRICSSCNPNILIYRKDNKYGFISLTEGVVAKNLFESYYSLKGDLINVRLDGQLGYIDKEGNFTLDEREGYF